MRDHPTIQDIREAQERLKPHIRRTPLLHAEKIEQAAGCRLYLKPETLQITGAFKIRGALNKTLSLPREEIANGIIATSSGNHAQGLAYAARMLGVKAILVLPVTTPKIKIANTEALGAEVILFDGDTAARWKKVYEIAEKNRYAVVHAFEDPLVMAGQGTIGCEILEDLQDVDTVIIPMGGGGLISGIATAIKETRPSVRVVGAEPALTPKYYHSRLNKERTTLPLKNTIADGLRISVPGQNPYPIIERYVDQIVLVEDQHIIQGMRVLAKDAKLIAEPAASIGIGALLAGVVKVRPDEKVCAVLSGGNWDLCDLAEIYSAVE
ncbi:threonine/serine dehydratase [Cupriavidus taiwanensis]|uniref:L-threonine dehydratase catabolic TdcB n=1 Tax=Cupriavidus taiwanensis TaxID=164546 RepID=A0A375IQV6_9BURK|nr:threonine/serine dehydratase [Cupriavidus taiwanensis]SOY67034.1 L-threonine dehydratase catabolic TdcB [Cupriavidus taiwanensis]SOY67097.1 L-threonine dehydratase catabolic TdcB [Cupriavidus taiwanensis]SOY94781.1 L-threonine dehydratase catabolic TdcB [Cupriavidus taiwanensis]SOZ28126.1 L-threonine dehydratase catabolic TdcB [Cupriavidus taiwanensis]SOZ71672.1 L-threonine dehydratase catabolic TdcB [Cupriavidus taiwanensis]